MRHLLGLVARTIALGLTVAWLSGCSTSALWSAVAANAVTTAAQERAETQQLAQQTARPEPVPRMDTESAYLAVITQLQAQGLWFAALAHLDALETRWKPSEHSRLLRADALRQTGQAVASAQLYHTLLDGHHAAQAQHGLGLLAAQAGAYAQAVNHLEAARRMAPTDALLLNDLGYARLHTADGALARMPLMQAAQLQTGHPRIQSNVAVFLVLHGEGAQAQQWMDRCQMDAGQRQQVFTTAQQLAVVALEHKQNQPVTPVSRAKIASELIAFEAPSP